MSGVPSLQAHARTRLGKQPRRSFSRPPPPIPTVRRSISYWMVGLSSDFGTFMFYLMIAVLLVSAPPPRVRWCEHTALCA